MLSSNKKTMTGVLLESTLDNYLILHAMAKDMSKTKVVEEVLIAWYKKNKSICPVDVLLENLKFSLQSNWKIAKGNGINFEKFINDSKAWLEARRIPTAQIEIITNIQE
jgi:hypothetical protein